MEEVVSKAKRDFVPPRQLQWQLQIRRENSAKKEKWNKRGSERKRESEFHYYLNAKGPPKNLKTTQLCKL